MSIFSADSLVLKMAKHLSEESLINFISKTNLTYMEATQLYCSAIEFNQRGVLSELFKRNDINSSFSFLGDLPSEWLKKGELWKLAFPEFSSKGLSFKEIIKDLTREDYNKDVLKKIGQLTLKNGLVPLNNLVYLNNIYRKKKWPINEFFRIDHSKPFLAFEPLTSSCTGFFLRKYGPERISKLIRVFDKETPRIITDIYFQLEKSERLQVIGNLPRKPQSLDEIKRYLETYFHQQIDPEKELNQAVFNLNQRTIEGYQIMVPRFVHDLNLLAMHFKNCLNRYYRHLLKKEFQVFVLCKDSNPEIVVELTEISGKSKITQFKGKKNETVRNANLIEKVERFINANKFESKI